MQMRHRAEARLAGGAQQLAARHAISHGDPCALCLNMHVLDRGLAVVQRQGQRIIAEEERHVVAASRRAVAQRVDGAIGDREDGRADRGVQVDGMVRGAMREMREPAAHTLRAQVRLPTLQREVNDESVARLTHQRLARQLASQRLADWRVHR